MGMEVPSAGAHEPEGQAVDKGDKGGWEVGKGKH